MFPCLRSDEQCIVLRRILGAIESLCPPQLSRYRVPNEYMAALTMVGHLSCLLELDDTSFLLVLDDVSQARSNALLSRVVYYEYVSQVDDDNAMSNFFVAVVKRILHDGLFQVSLGRSTNVSSLLLLLVNAMDSFRDQ